MEPLNQKRLDQKGWIALPSPFERKRINMRWFWMLLAVGYAQFYMMNDDTLYFSSNNDTLYVQGDVQITNGHVFHKKGVFQFSGASFELNMPDSVRYRHGGYLWYKGRLANATFYFTPGDTIGTFVMEAANNRDVLELIQPDFFWISDSILFKKGRILAQTVAGQDRSFIVDSGAVQIEAAPPDTSYVEGFYIILFANYDTTFKTFFLGETKGDTMFYLPFGLQFPKGLSVPYACFGAAAFRRAPIGGIPGRGIAFFYNDGLWKLAMGSCATNDSFRVRVYNLPSPIPPPMRIAASRTQNESSVYNSLGPVVAYNSPNGWGPGIQTQNTFNFTAIGNASPFFALGAYQCNVDSILFVYDSLSDGRVCEGDTLWLKAKSLWPLGYAENPTLTFYWQQWNPVLSQWDTIAVTSVDSAYYGMVNGAPLLRVVVEDGTCIPDASAIQRVPTKPSLKIRLRALLEGTYDGASDVMIQDINMYALLRGVFEFDNFALSQTQMYRGYQVPSDAVDVLQVFLVDMAGNHVDTALGWVTTNGIVKDFYSGLYDYVSFGCKTAIAPYAVVALHRNHLPIISSFFVNPDTILGGSNAMVDLTIPFFVKDAGLGAKIDPNSGRAVMWLGNAWFDDEVNALDFYLIQANNGVLINYVQEDVNLDTFVNAGDLNKADPNNLYLRRSTVGNFMLPYASPYPKPIDIINTTFNPK